MAEAVPVLAPVRVQVKEVPYAIEPDLSFDFETERSACKAVAVTVSEAVLLLSLLSAI